MLNIDTQTLNAIQDNIKTDEWQELTQEKELVKTVSWKDFEVVGNKPNLIENGWDSFEPFPNITPLGQYYNEMETKEVSGWYASYGTDFKAEPDTVYVVQWEYEHIEGFVPYLDIGASIHPNGYSSDIYTSIIKADKNFRHEFKLRESDIENGRFYISFRLRFNQNYGKYKFGNIKIYEKEKEVPKVEKTPLGNGLTRIQTWGGNSDTKLRYENTGLKSLAFIGNGKGNIKNNDNIVEIENFTTIIGEGSFELVGDLDFVASDPQIVEGDVPNATMVVDTLEDGREHVQVFGANSDTKLVYKGGSGVVGEPYSFETKIDNLGKKLNFDTNIGSREIEKGTNDISVQGTLPESEFKISIGELK